MPSAAPAAAAAPEGSYVMAAITNTARAAPRRSCPRRVSGGRVTQSVIAHLARATSTRLRNAAYAASRCATSERCLGCGTGNARRAKCGSALNAPRSCHSGEGFSSWVPAARCVRASCGMWGAGRRGFSSRAHAHDVVIVTAQRRRRPAFYHGGVAQATPNVTPASAVTVTAPPFAAVTAAALACSMLYVPLISLISMTAEAPGGEGVPVARSGIRERCRQAGTANTRAPPVHRVLVGSDVECATAYGGGSRVLATPFERSMVPNTVTGPASLIEFTYAALADVLAVLGTSSINMAPPTSSR
jgi:hypothetical protein